MAEFRRSLDGLRAVAVLMVMLMHAGAPGLEAGYLGVDVFFVLSGFLITSLSCAELQRYGRLDMRGFLARRFLRLMPLYWLYLLVITALVLLSPPETRHTHAGWDTGEYLAALWLYLGNLPPLGGIWDGQALTGHLWSLSVEAQYYVVWPLLLPLLFRSRHGALGAAALAVISLSINLFGEAPPGKLSLHTRGIGLCLGSAFAFATLEPGRVRRLCARTPAMLTAVVTMVVLVGVHTWLRRARGMDESGALATGLLPAFDLASAVLVAHLWWSPASRVGSALSQPALVYLGQRSYGMYLLHMVCHWLTWELLLADIEQLNRYIKFGLRASLFIGSTTALAALSFRFYERPFLKLKDRFRPTAPEPPVADAQPQP